MIYIYLGQTVTGLSLRQRFMRLAQLDAEGNQDIATMDRLTEERTDRWTEGRTNRGTDRGKDGWKDDQPAPGMIVIPLS